MFTLDKGDVMRNINILKYIVLCILLGGVMFASVVTRKMKDTVPPVIYCEDEELLVSVEDDADILMKGITAIDAVDGDVTDLMLIEKMSIIDSEGCRKVTYGAFDNNNNVSKHTRTIRYADYESPRYYLTGDMIFQTWNMSEAMGMIRAEDCIDGDISKQVKLYSFEGDYTSNFRTLKVYVTNSSGETVEHSFMVELLASTAEKYTMGPKLALKDYLIYLKKGEKAPDWREFLASVKVVGDDRVISDVEDFSDVTIISNVDMDTPGDYDVTYTYEDSHEYVGKTRLFVIVEE